MSAEQRAAVQKHVPPHARQNGDAPHRVRFPSINRL